MESRKDIHIILDLNQRESYFLCLLLNAITEDEVKQAFSYEVERFRRSLISGLPTQ